MHDRFQEWRAAGVFQRLWQEGLIEYDVCHGLDWGCQAMDGAMTKAPLGGGKEQALILPTVASWVPNEAC